MFINARSLLSCLALGSPVAEHSVPGAGATEELGLEVKQTPGFASVAQTLELVP